MDRQGRHSDTQTDEQRFAWIASHINVVTNKKANIFAVKLVIGTEFTKRKRMN